MRLIIACIIKILIGKPIGKRPLGRPRRTRDDSIRMELKEIGINTRSWVDSAQDRHCLRALVNSGFITHGVS